jgi:hypothetical protein
MIKYSNTPIEIQYPPQHLQKDFKQDVKWKAFLAEIRVPDIAYVRSNKYHS